MFKKRKRRDQAIKRSELVNLYLLGAMPVALTMLNEPGARRAAQIFILGMIDMQRQVERFSMEEFTDVDELVLEAHSLLPEQPVAEFIDEIERDLSGNQAIRQLMSDGASSLRAYVAEKDSEAPIDLARAIACGKASMIV